MRRLGHLEGVNLVIEARFARDQPDRLPALAAELVQLPVDVLATLSTPAARAATNVDKILKGAHPPIPPLSGDRSHPLSRDTWRPHDEMVLPINPFTSVDTIRGHYIPWTRLSSPSQSRPAGCPKDVLFFNR